MKIKKMQKNIGIIAIIFCLLTATTLAGNTLNKTQISDHLNTLRNASTDIGSYGDILINIFNANGEIKSEFLEASSLWDVSGNNISYTTGNVGIGTVATSAKLQVNGKIQSTATTVGDSTSTLVTKGYIDTTYLSKSHIEGNYRTNGYIDSTYIKKNGGVVTNMLNVNNQRLYNLPAPTGNNDAANKAYVDAVVAASSGGGGGGGNYQVACGDTKCLRMNTTTGEAICQRRDQLLNSVSCPMNFAAGVNGNYQLSCSGGRESTSADWIQCVRINTQTGISECKRHTRGGIPVNCNIAFDGNNKKLMFITTTLYNGNLGGETGADSKCTQRANAIGFTGNYKAYLLGNNNSSITSKLGNHAMVNIRGEDILSGTISAQSSAIRYNDVELNVSGVGGFFRTGINGSGGKSGNNCNNFTSTSGISTGGNAGSAGGAGWFATYHLSCSIEYPLLCIED